MWKEFSPRFIVEYRNHVLLRCEEYGIPPKIALGMILTESQGNPLAVGKNISSEGKLLSTDRGIMQLNSMYFADKIKRRIPGTDTIYEYQPFIYVYDNIDLGLQYLVEMHQKFGNWPQAIQAYNCGPTAVLNKQIPKRTVKYLDSVLLFTSLY